MLMVLIDDAGFGNPSTFGGPIQTPNYTRMADGGVQYNRFHVTALCSPTRAALLTGRNSHYVGFGSVGEFAGGFPGYCATLPRDCAPLPRILRDNGYSTAAIGKWHLTPDGQQGPAGPFDRWPNGWGFDYFYGFLGGGASQWDPCLAENQKIIGTPAEFYDEDNPYYFPDAMADKTIEWLHGVRAQDAHKPFFAYFSTGCSHSPHHVSSEWADKYKGKFDQGWDKLREETFARQKELGVIPADAELTVRDEAFPAWDGLADDLKRFYARQMEVYAGFSENADHNVGRVIDAIDELGELDNTVILWIWGDNGASMEGTITGSFNELTMQNGIPLTDEMQLQLSERYGGLDQWGAPIMDPHYSAAWAWAGNTPFQWGKQVGSHLGGTRNPLVVHWPNGVKDKGGLRSQFTHMIDVAPTILELAGIPEPTDGGRHRAGADARDHVHPVADRPGRRRTPHPAVLRDRRQPGHVQGRLVAGREDRTDPLGPHPGGDHALRAGRLGPRLDPAELYYLPDDFSQANDLAAQHPEKVAELKELFWQEAERYRVLPLLATLSTFFGILPPITDETTFEFRGDVQNVLSGMIPRIYNRSYSITADLVIPDGGAEGRDRGRGRPPRRVHPLHQGRQAHPHLLDDGRFHLQAGGRSRCAQRHHHRRHGVRSRCAETRHRRRGDPVHQRPTRWQGSDGAHRAGPVLRLRRHGYRQGQRRGRRYGSYEDLKPFAFTGTVNKVTFNIKPHQTAEDALELHTAAHRGDVAHGLSA